MKITIVIPTYNEAENLSKITASIFEQSIPGLDILIVDDNSPDGTGMIADELADQSGGRLRVLHREQKLGLGKAYLHGFQVAIDNGADVIGQMDADFSHPPEKLRELAGEVQNCDIVVGSRYVRGGEVDRRWPLWRKGLSAFGNFYARTILNLPIRDATGGFRMYRREILSAMPLDRVISNGYVFQVELAYLAHLLGFRFKEIPIYFADRKWGDSKMTLRIQVEAALRVWMVLFAYQDIR